MFGRKPSPEMVPVNPMAVLMDIHGMHLAEGYDEAPRWMPREEFEREIEEELANMPTVDELLEDPDVRAVVEAAGKGACLLAISRQK